MKRNIYGLKMLVADLIVTSIWTLFAVKSVPEIEYWVIAAILMRIVLSFQLFDNSRWSGYCSIIFACAYFMLPNHHTFGFQHAPAEMIYYGLNIFDWGLANEFCLNPDALVFHFIFYLIWGLLSVWLVLMPLIVLSLNKIIFKFPKWSWINIVPFVISRC